MSVVDVVGVLLLLLLLLSCCAMAMKIFGGTAKGMIKKEIDYFLHLDIEKSLLFLPFFSSSIVISNNNNVLHH